MSLFNRYVLRLVVQSLVISLTTSAALMWIVAAFRQMDELSGKGQGLGILFKMTSLAMPNLIAIITPFAFLITCLSVLNKLNGDSELIIMSASGNSIWKIARPIITTAAGLTALLYIVGFWVQPASLQSLRHHIVKVRTDLIANILQTGTFSSPINGLVVHLRDRNRDGKLVDLLVYDNRDPKQKLTYLAETGRVVKQGKKAFLIMEDGHIHRQIPPDPNIQIIAFDRYSFDLSQLSDSDKTLTYRPRAMYVSQLMNPSKDDQYYKRFPGKFRAELHERLSSPLYMILFASIALAFLGTPRTVRQKRGKLYVMAIVIAIVARIIGLSLTNLNQAYTGTRYLVYIWPTFGILLALAYCHFSMTGLALFSKKQKTKTTNGAL